MEEGNGMKRLLVVFCLIAAAFGGSVFGSGYGTALAASSTGAYPINNSGCYPLLGGTICFSVNGVTNLTSTNSGNTTYVYSAYECVSLTFSGTTYFSTCHRYNTTTVTKQGQAQVDRHVDKGEFTLYGQTCSYQTVYTYANGEVRADQQKFSCA